MIIRTLAWLPASGHVVRSVTRIGGVARIPEQFEPGTLIRVRSYSAQTFDIAPPSAAPTSGIGCAP
jgi:hypothetical protein